MDAHFPKEQPGAKVLFGAGSEVMHRIAAPMLGGMLTAPILSMLVIPVLYRLRKR
jgi:Cu(I)/Ag(I) efflux system membrane protein CusA/SilA